jgi:hypothetical protein
LIGVDAESNTSSTLRAAYRLEPDFHLGMGGFSDAMQDMEGFTMEGGVGGELAAPGARFEINERKEVEGGEAGLRGNPERTERSGILSSTS